MPAWLVAAEGVAAFAAAVVLGRILLRYTASPLLFHSFDGEPRNSVLLMLSFAAVAVMAAPALAWPLGRAGGWVLATLGLVTQGLLNGSLLNREVIVVGAEPLLLVASGLVLGGVVAALATGSSAERVTVAFGLAAGLSASPGMFLLALRFGSFWPRWPYFAAAATAGTAALVVMARRRLNAAGAVSESASEFANSPVPSSACEPGGTPIKMVLPALVVIAVAGAVLLADALRLAVTDAIALSADGVATSRRAEAAMTVDWVAQVAIVVVLGLLLVWYGYARGGVAVGRWVCTGLGLLVLLSPGLQRSLDVGGSRTWLLVVVAVGGAGLSVLLTQLADRAAPWDALGLMLVAAGFLFAFSRLDQELTPGWPLGPFVLGAGLGLTLGAGLGRIAAWPDRGRPSYVRASDAGLGFACTLLAAGVIAPLLASTAYGPRLASNVPWQPPAVVAVAAVVVVLFFGLARVVDRIRRDIYAEAAAAAQ